MLRHGVDAMGTLLHEPVSKHSNLIGGTYEHGDTETINRHQKCASSASLSSEAACLFSAKPQVLRPALCRLRRPADSG